VPTWRANSACPGRRAFAGTMPGQKLPFGLRPTSEGARGSDIIIEGIAEEVIVRLEGFTQS
jgi:hypothetical protein